MVCTASVLRSPWGNDMTVKYMILVALVAALSGCATGSQPCDASDNNASLITKMNCDHAGGYSQQISQREQELTAARAENEAFHQLYQDLQQQQQQVGRTLAEQQQQQAKLEQSMKQLLVQLKNRHAGKSQVQQQIAELEQQMSQARQAVSNATPATLQARQQELQMLRQKVSRLQLSLGYE